MEELIDALLAIVHNLSQLLQVPNAMVGNLSRVKRVKAHLLNAIEAIFVANAREERREMRRGTPVSSLCLYPFPLSSIFLFPSSIQLSKSSHLSSSSSFSPRSLLPLPLNFPLPLPPYMKSAVLQLLSHLTLLYASTHVRIL